MKEQIKQVLEIVNRTIENGDTILAGSAYHKIIKQTLAELSQVKPSVWLPASYAPYDEMCLFYTVDGNIVQGFIYDGDEKDFGYTHYMPLPAAPELTTIKE